MTYKHIYTIGCFDFFHSGHEVLFKTMQTMGKRIIVGIHDDTSIEKLKDLQKGQHQPLEVRMKNVRRFADQVYVVASTNPTFYLECMILDSDDKESACYVRSDDMPNFPGREFVEKKIDIQLVPYTMGVSSTEIRKNLNKRSFSNYD